MRCVFVALNVLWHQVCVEADDELDVALATLERQANDLGGIEVEFEFEVGVAPYGATTIPVQTRHRHRQCIDGRLIRLETVGTMNLSNPEEHDVTYVRGVEVQKKFDRIAKRGEIHGQMRFPLDYMQGISLFPGGLEGRLKEIRNLAKCRRIQNHGKELLQVVWNDDELRGDVTCLLDPSHFYQPAEVQFDVPMKSSDSLDGRNRILIKLDVLGYWESQRAALPSHVHETCEAFWPDGKQRLTCEKSLVVKSVKRNVHFNPGEFDIEFPRGTLVTDVVRQVYYQQGFPESKTRFSHNSTAEAAASPPQRINSDVTVHTLGRSGVGFFPSR